MWRSEGAGEGLGRAGALLGRLPGVVWLGLRLRDGLAKGGELVERVEEDSEEVCDRPF